MIAKSKYNYIVNHPDIIPFEKPVKSAFFKLIYFLDHNGASSFHSTKLQEWFGKNYTYLVRIVCETDNRFSVEEGYCKTYWLKTTVSDYLQNFDRLSMYKTQSFAERTTEDIVDINGKTMNTLPENSVLKYDINGKRKQSSVNIPKVLYIDYDALLDAIKTIDVVIKSKDMLMYNLHFKPKKVRDFETLKQVKLQLENILLMAKNSFSDVACIPIQYQEQGCGRLQGIYMNPQNMVSEIRNYILSSGGDNEGVWDYDISNCHFSIAYQMYNQIVKEKYSTYYYRKSMGQATKFKQYRELSALKNYLDNKEQIRNAVALETNRLVIDAKILLISLMYGKRVSKNELQMSPTLKALKEDIDYMIPVIAKYKKYILNNIIINDAKKTKNVTKMLNTHKLNHIMLGVEAVIIDKVASKYPDNIMLLMFDGFVSNSQIFELEMKPYEIEIGGFTYHLQFESKKLK